MVMLNNRFWISVMRMSTAARVTLLLARIYNLGDIHEFCKFASTEAQLDPKSAELRKLHFQEIVNTLLAAERAKKLVTVKGDRFRRRIKQGGRQVNEFCDFRSVAI